MIAYDSDNLDDIPDTAQFVLYYADGQPGTATLTQLARFPSAIKQSITRDPFISAYWGDVEPGCIWPIATAVSVWRQKLVKGLYVDESNWASLRAALSTAGLIPPPYWVAQYPNVFPTSISQSWIDLGCVMWQVADDSTSGGHYDLSITAPNFPIITAPLSKELTMNGPIILPSGAKLYSGIYPANGHVIELEETGPSTNAYLWRDINDLCTNNLPTPCPPIS